MENVTVTSCEVAKEVNGKSVYKVGLSDGRFGESFANQIPKGTPASDLQIDDTQWGLKFKLIKKNGFAGGGGRKAGNESFALSYAKDLGIANIAAGKAFGSKEILAVAEVFYQWLETKKS